MKNVTKVLLLLSVFAIGLSSCSKEKRIERHLYTKSGKWNNTLYDYKYYNNGVQEDATVYVNAGYIEYEKDGKYTWFFSGAGTMDVSNGNWSNTESTLTLVGPNGTSLVWNIVEESKKKMTLQYTETEGNEKEVYTLSFEKAN